MTSMRGVDVAEERKVIAEHMWQDGAYELNGSQLHIINPEGNISAVDLVSMSCDCIASSHEIHCVCKHVVENIESDEQALNATRD